MKSITIGILLISLGLLYCPKKALGSDFGLLKYPTKLLEIEYAIQALRPNIPESLKKEIAHTVLDLTERHNVDWKRYLSILFQESSLQLDPRTNGKKCIHRVEKCHDFGIGQVSYYYWGEKLQIDRKKALKETKYSISLSFIVYIHYHKRYSKRERTWYTRYHSGTPSRRRGYRKRIDAHYGKIVVAQKQFRRKLRNGPKTISHYNYKEIQW